MTISNLHRLDKIILPSSVEFHAIKNQRWDAGIQTLLERGAGETHPNFLATGEQKPMVGFTTPQLATLLENVGIAGFTPSGAINTYFKRSASTGVVARATTSHTRVQLPVGCLYWTTIRLPHNGIATADVVIISVWDGSNAPFGVTGSVALSGTLSPQSYFGAGPASVNGVAVGAIKEITISSGIRLVEEGGESEVYNSFVGIEVTEPRVDIQTQHMVNWGTYGLAGSAIVTGSGGLDFYARKYAADGQRVAAGTAEHILFSAEYGRAIPLDTSGDGSNPLSDRARFELRVNASDALPLAITVGSAIS